MSVIDREAVRPFVKWVAILFAVSLVFSVIGIGIGGFGEIRHESNYSGVVVDLEVERGIVLQTTQAHMKTDHRSSSHETFCVLPEHQDEQLPIIRDAVSTGDRLTITYERPLYVPLWECADDTSVITNIESYQGGSVGSEEVGR